MIDAATAIALAQGAKEPLAWIAKKLYPAQKNVPDCEVHAAYGDAFKPNSVAWVDALRSDESKDKRGYFYVYNDDGARVYRRPNPTHRAEDREFLMYRPADIVRATS